MPAPKRPNTPTITNAPPPPKRTTHQQSLAIETMTLDGHVHIVAEHLEHEIARQVVVGWDEHNNELRDVEQDKATRFKMGCGLGFDARHEHVEHEGENEHGKLVQMADHIGNTADHANDRWKQGKKVDCPGCLAWKAKKDAETTPPAH